MLTPVIPHRSSEQNRSSVFSSMAALKSQHPSSSASSHPENKFRYDLFLSFRGLDTRKKFTDHLYHAMKREGFQTFRDNDEIEKGDVIKPELHKAIMNSRMSVIVLSENYANSKACLFELHTILELCKKSDHFVLPVFYEVEPAVLKEQSKNLVFGEKEVTPEKLERWSAALREVATMAGHVLRKKSDGYEANLIEEIVSKLKTKLAGKNMMVCDHPVGLDSRAKRVNSWLNGRLARVGTLLICGMGGIGKTTIAKHIFNSNHPGYDAACFLLNISKVAKQHGLVSLQRQLLSDILGKKEPEVNDVDDGCRRIKYVLRNKRVLLVLDDVDQMDQLSALAGRQDWFYPGSKIIITSRLESVMNCHENYEVHSPVKLSNFESLELFSWHAFGHKYPIHSHMDLSERFVKYCDGIPLALEVLGCSVRWKNVDVWESELKKLEATANYSILEKLEISFGSLRDDHDKNLFLDVACFFVGKKKNETITILEGCDYCALAGIHNLVDRNLISIKNEILEMHQLLQDMGKQIVCRESMYPGKRSRIWSHKESSNILLQKTGTKTIEGLVLDKNMLRDSKMVVFEANTFERMYYLRLLKLSGVKLSGTYKAFPKNLRWLYWHGFPSESFPNEFPLDNLVCLDMRYSNLKQVWIGSKVFGSLKILNLSHSLKLAKTPDFSRFPKLEKLVLKACPCLFEVDESILGLQQIELINLKDCKNLTKLPRNIGMLESLVEIDISGCSNLMGAVEELEKMKSLQVLKASRMDTDHWLTVEVASQASIWPWVPKPRVQMSLASLPSSLVQLNLSDCNLAADAFPMDLSNLSKLQLLRLSGNPVSRLPNSIKDLTSLQTLDLRRCEKLQQIRWSSTFLHHLDVSRCEALKEVTFETGTSIGYISSRGCPDLNHVDGMFKIIPVREVDVELINSIGFFNLGSMADLDAKIMSYHLGSHFKCPTPIQIVIEGNVLYRVSPGREVPDWFSNTKCWSSNLFHTFFPGREVPDWFSNTKCWSGNLFYTSFPGREVPDWFSNKKCGSTMSFIARLSPHFGFRGMNLCAVYSYMGDSEYLKSGFHFEIDNKSSGLKTIGIINVFGIPERGGDMVWLSHCFEANLFAEGDEVEVSFITFGAVQIRECGVHVLYFEEGVEVLQYFLTIQRSLDPSLTGAIEVLKKMIKLQVLKASSLDTDRCLTKEVASQASFWPWVPKPRVHRILLQGLQMPPRVQMAQALVLSSLGQLNLSDGNLTDRNLTDEEFPRGIIHFPKLQVISLCGNPVSRLPNFIKGLTSLQTLDLRRCEKLQQIRWSSTFLQYLDVSMCEALKEVTFETGTGTRYFSNRGLNHVQGRFKIIPVREVDVELINSIGFSNLDSMADLDAKIMSCHLGFQTKFPIPIQIVGECNVFYTFFRRREVPGWFSNGSSNLFHTSFPGREVPDWFSNKKWGSTMSFTATLSPHFGFRGLNLCAVYTYMDDSEYLTSGFHIEIDNKSSGMMTIGIINIFGIPKRGGDMVWLSHCFEANLFGEGDKVEVSFITYGAVQIRECGVHVLYFEEEGEVSQYFSTIERSLDPNLAPYEPDAGYPVVRKKGYPV